eukprot:PhM_4_TR18504/c2_g3_i1/m.56656
MGSACCNSQTTTTTVGFPFALSRNIDNTIKKEAPCSSALSSIKITTQTTRTSSLSKLMTSSTVCNNNGQRHNANNGNGLYSLSASVVIQVMPREHQNEPNEGKDEDGEEGNGGKTISSSPSRKFLQRRPHPLNL